jgi:anti-anti-sigma regulatory factor
MLEYERVASALILRDLGDIRHPDFRADVERLIEDGQARLVFDVSGLSVHSVTFALLICWRTLATDRGGDLVLVRPTTVLQRHLEALGIDKRLLIFEREEDGLAYLHFGDSPPTAS